jgi:hypothetical protein
MQKAVLALHDAAAVPHFSCVPFVVPKSECSMSSAIFIGTDKSLRQVLFNFFPVGSERLHGFFIDFAPGDE